MFVAPPGPASDWGYAARGHWGWDRRVRYTWVTRPEACPADHEVVVGVSVEGAIEVIRGGASPG